MGAPEHLRQQDLAVKSLIALIARPPSSVAFIEIHFSRVFPVTPWEQENRRKRILIVYSLRISVDGAAPHLDRLSPFLASLIPDPPLSGDNPVETHVAPSAEPEDPQSD
jgi:hypothetical protein